VPASHSPFCRRGRLLRPSRIGPGRRPYSRLCKTSRLMEDAVREQGGVVQSFAGDGIMAVFGASVAFEDAPQLACRAALAILERLKAVGVGAAPVDRRIIALRRIAGSACQRDADCQSAGLLQTTCAITPRLVWPCDEERAERLSRSICRRLRSQRGERSTRAP
jgi:hypothetical protein